MTRSPFRILAALLLIGSPSMAVAESTPDETTIKLTVSAPYLDMHSGPGRGFPVDHSVVRGEVMEVVERHTDWYHVRTSRGETGWIHRKALQSPDGKLPPATSLEARDALAVVNLALGSFDGIDCAEASVEVSIMSGVSLGASYLLGGDMENTVDLYSATVRQYFEPIGSVTPWAGGGVGTLTLENETRGIDERLTLPHVSAGVDLQWLERTRIRFEYRHHIPNSSNEDIQESDEWKAGIAVYY